MVSAPVVYSITTTVPPTEPLMLDIAEHLRDQRPEIAGYVFEIVDDEKFHLMVWA